MIDPVPPFWHPSRVRALLLDWDGVLAETHLDFSPLRQRFYGGRRAMLLEEASTLPPEERVALMEALRDLEIRGAREAEPIPGVPELLAWLEETRTPWAVVSRNCREAIEEAARRVGVALPSVTLTREDGDAPKPDPRVLWHAAASLGVRPRDCAFVGDFLYDLVGARRGGMRAVLVQRSDPAWEPWTDVVYPTLEAFAADLRTPRPLVPWEYGDLVRREGAEVLSARFEDPLLVPCGEDLRGLPEALLRAAEEGYGTFLLRDPGRLTPDRWKTCPLLDPSLLGEPLERVLGALLEPRYPLARVEPAGEGAYRVLPVEDPREGP